jgi:hypothetical protein
MKKVLLIISLFLLKNIIIAQINPEIVEQIRRDSLINSLKPQNLPNCGTDELLKQNPEIQAQLMKQQEAYLKNRASFAPTDVIPDNTTIFTIPVVFHVFHLGEAVGTGSNVSDFNIQQALVNMNQEYRAQNEINGISPDTRIQFSFAEFNPSCQPTNGIVRVDGRVVSGYNAEGISYVTGGSIFNQLTTLSTWPSNNYINIYIFSAITGGAYAFAQYNGSLYMPSAAINSNFGFYAWAHEMGHSMNLAHTFQGDGYDIQTGVSLQCPPNTNPNTQGDQVSDTDPHKAQTGTDELVTNECTNTPFGTIIRNQMSYTRQNIFTQKQKERMRYALLNYRPSLVNPVTVNSVTINNGATASLTASGCTGTVNWYNVPYGGNSLASGVSFTTPSLSTTTSYYAKCTSSGCTSRTRTEGLVTVNNSINPIVVNPISGGYCINSTVNISFTNTATLPAGSFYTAILRKGNRVITYKRANTSPISFTIPQSEDYVYNNITNTSREIPMEYGSDYNIIITAGQYTSNPSNNFTIGKIGQATITDINKNTIYNDQICNGATKIYYASVKNLNGTYFTDNISYQWKKDGNNISNATNPTLSVNTNGSYTVETSQGCTVISSPTTLQFGSNINNYIINNGGNVLCNGLTKKLESNYYTNTSTYQWQKDGNNISGAVNKSLNTTESGNYRVVINDLTCNSTAYPTKIYFGTGLLANIYADRGDTVLCGVNSYKFAIADSDREIPYTYQWQKDGVNMPNENRYYYYITQPGAYKVTYTQGSCSTTSKAINFISSTTSQKPTILANGEITSICSGSIALSQPNNQYINGQWYKDNVQISPNSSTNYTATQSGTYKMVNNTFGCTNESNSVVVSIGTELIPKIIPSGNKTNICGTSDYVLLIYDKNIGGEAYNFIWKKDGQTIPNQTSYYLFAYLPGDYTLVATNGTCTSTSNAIVITNNLVTGTVQSSENNLLCTNKVVKLDFKGPKFNYYNPIIWRKNGIIIPNETLNYIYTNEPGNYTVDYNETGCAGTTIPLVLNIGSPSPPAVNSPSINWGQTATLTATDCIGTVKWYNAPTGGDLQHTGVTFTTPILNANTNYYASCTIDLCESGNRALAAVTELICTQMQTTKSGDWNDPTVWSCGRIPTSTDEVIISSGNIIIVPNGIFQVKNITMEGTINYNEGGEIRLNQ